MTEIWCVDHPEIVQKYGRNHMNVPQRKEGCATEKVLEESIPVREDKPGGGRALSPKYF